MLRVYNIKRILDCSVIFLRMSQNEIPVRIVNLNGSNLLKANDFMNFVTEKKPQTNANEIDEQAMDIFFIFDA